MIIISGNDYVKFITQRIISYIDLPPEEKKERKRNNRNPSHAWTNHWLGVLPFALKYYRKHTQ